MSKTKMETLCDALVKCYHEYSGQTKDLERDALDRAEFKKMVKEQFPHYLEHAKDPEAMNKLFTELDKDKDQRLNFEETMNLLAKVIIYAHDKSHEHESAPCHQAHPH